MQTKFLALAFALLATGVWANGIVYTAINRFPVAIVDQANFEVIARGGRVTARHYWCAAGDYGLASGQRSNARIYISAPEGPSATTGGRKAVRFTFTPDAAGITPISPQLNLSVDAVGDNMSIAQARQFCSGSGVLGF